MHTYHSFRSTAITVLKRAKVDIDMRCQLVGHEFHTGMPCRIMLMREML
jgi:hypothetical protein